MSEMLLVKLMLTLFVFIILFLMVAPSALLYNETPLQRKVIEFLKFVITFLIVAIAVIALQGIWAMV